MNPIDETLRKMAEAISANQKSAGGPESAAERPPNLPGDPNCPICQGIGFLRRDLPIGHPDFGKLSICTCRQGQVGRTLLDRLYRMSNLEALKGFTFETFEQRGRSGLSEEQIVSLEVAFNYARQYAQNLQGWLLFQGTYGCGKTHLAAAIANTVVSLGVPTLFLTAPDLLDWLRFAYDSPETSFEQRFEEIRTIGLLVLDDFGTQNATSWAQEKLFQILNYRYVNHLPLVITTNQSLESIEPRIRSRLMDSSIVRPINIKAPDYRNPREDNLHSKLSSLSLHPQRTFATFSARQNEGIDAGKLKTLQDSLRAAQDYAEKPAGWLVITGDYGCGKTHLAAAIGNYRTDLGQAPLMVVVPDLLDHLRATFSPNSSVSYDSIFEEVRNAPVLILDDLGTQSATPWAREKLYQLFNHRYVASLPTVITTSTRLEDMDGRIRSRMEDKSISRIIELRVPAFRGVADSAEAKPGRKKGGRRVEEIKY